MKEEFTNLCGVGLKMGLDLFKTYRAELALGHELGKLEIVRVGLGPKNKARINFSLGLG